MRAMERLMQKTHRPDLKTSEERMAHTIRTYRKYGKYGDANRVEEQLAKLQKRPPVLVPSPEVAQEGLSPKPAPTGRKPAPAVDLDWDMVPE